MPIYNAEEFLSDAIDSVLSQTFCEFELSLFKKKMLELYQNI